MLLLASCMGNNQENTSEDLGTPVSVLEIPESFTWVVETSPIMVDGNAIELAGTRITVGTVLSDVTLDMKADYFDQVSTGSISDYPGYKIIETVPSLDTPVCTMQTKQLEEAAALYPDVSFLIISNDTPFALQRFCAANGIENVHVMSDARTREFGTQNGLLMPQYGLLARSIMIVDENNQVVYIDYAEEVTSELDLGNALAYLNSLLAQEAE